MLETFVLWGIQFDPVIDVVAPRSTIMSMEIEDAPPSTFQGQKKYKVRDVGKSEKKRKRQASDDLHLASPVKKHRSKYQSDSGRKYDTLSTNSETPLASSFFRQIASLYLPLPPISQKHALKGLCAEHLSPLILTYYPPFHGVIISYGNARLSSGPQAVTKPAYARSIDEYAASFVWLIVDFIIFKPQKGDVIEGWVNLQNESNIGLLCLNFFNVTIERRRLPKTWKWISGGGKPFGRRKLTKALKGGTSDSDEDMEGEGDAEEKSEEDQQGYFQDADGKKIEGLIAFRVKNVETSRNMDGETSFLSIEGSILSEEEERKLQEQEAIKIREGRKRQPRHAMAGALLNGHDGSMDVDQPTDMIPSLKHRAKY